VASRREPRSGRARFFANRAAAFGLALVALLVLFAVVGPLVARHDPLVSDFARGGTEDGIPVPPSSEFWLGTDRLFRDQFARLAHGARLSLAVSVAATLIATVIGTGVGITAGWFRRLDAPLMRLVDVGLSFPFLLLVMAVGAALDRTTATTLLVVLGLTGWLGTARVVRAKTMQVRDLEFVLAARALGQRTHRILWLHVLPNVLGPVIVLATAQVAQMILAESVLSYLGVGVAPPTPTWGHMLYEGQDNYAIAPWLVAAPAAAIVVAVFGFNLVGEGLRDALDPRED
jgi:peptide/nickel transport system permease protein